MPRKPDPNAARERYLVLLTEGESAGLTGTALGVWIAERLTPGELRELYRLHVSSPVLNIDRRQ